MTTYTLLDGKENSKQIRKELRRELRTYLKEGHRPPNLATIIVGNDPASAAYVGSKIKACEKVGIKSTHFGYPEDVKEEFIIAKIEAINSDPEIDGLLVQLPLPAHISEDKVIESIHPDKDVDGFHPVNIGRMAKNLPAPLPATPAGILQLFKRYNIDTKGKHAVVVGRSNIVGFPMSMLLGRNNEGGNATVTLTHRYTSDLAKYTQMADILVVAVGIPGFITEDMVKPGAVVIDVGINRIKDNDTNSGYRLVGDVSFEEVAEKCSHITPVPGGVGPMTIGSLLVNCMDLYKRHVLRA